MLDITMTATRRPELLVETLTSFTRLMLNEFDQKIRLIINVDPVGHNIPSEDIVQICKGFFSNVIARCPEQASFPQAFRWCWEQTTSPFIFNLEEDWRLLYPIDLNHMQHLMQTTSELVILRLPFSPCNLESNKSWGHFIPWNGAFYEVPTDSKGLLGFSGHPSLIDRKFVSTVLKTGLLDGRRNPEKQLKWRHLHPLQAFRYGVYGSPGKGAAVVDIGRTWKTEHGWKKVDNAGNNNKAFFTKWETI